MNIPSYVSGAIFAKAHKILRDTVRGCLKVHGLSPTGWSLLGSISRAPEGIRLVTLADQLSVRAPLVTAISNDLEGRELIRRVAHHSDGRAKLLIITPKGQQFIQEVESDVEKHLEFLLRNLQKEDLEGYKKVLETIIANGS